MSFLKGLWKKKKGGPRSLDHAGDLMQGDMVQLANHFGLPGQLRDKTFRVVGICTYQFEHGNDTCFSLESTDDDHINLTIESDAGRDTAVFSFSVSRSTVGELFDLDEFAQVFDGEDASSLTLKSDAGLDGWVASDYVQEIKGEKGYFYNRDYRQSAPPVHDGEGEPFEYHFLLSEDETKGVEIEVFAGGETEVSLTLYCDMEMIRELWPAEK
jgi:hypothetical protein